MPTKTSFDYIVVGAGSAGCVIAARLSEKGSVLLLERGPSEKKLLPKPEFAEFVKLYKNVLAAVLLPFEMKTDLYPTTPQTGLNGRTLFLLRGVMRGGCSSINGMIYVRGNRRDYDLWANLGNEGWSYEEVLPFFRKSEKHWAGDSRFHGAAGPLTVNRIPHPSRAALAFIEAAHDLRLSDRKVSDPAWDFNGSRQENAADLYDVNVQGDLRVSGATGFLDGFAGDNALEIETAAEVRAVRIVIEGHRAVGVACIDGTGQPVVYRAAREVIVAAGALESPKLLMLSGIGPAQHLESVGIPVRVHLPGVGQNLHDHLQIPVYHPAQAAAGQSEFTAEAGLFLHTRDKSGVASPDLQYHVLAGMPAVPGSELATGLPPLDHPNDRFFVISPVLCTPQSRGELRLRTSNPADLPVIDPHYLECEADVDVLVRGLEIAGELARTNCLKMLRDEKKAPFVIPDFTHPAARPTPPSGRSELAEFVRAAAITPWHPVGTCKMGRDRLAVVDPQLRVYGVEGLRVADASIMPAIPSGNTNAPSYMIGEKCAAMIS